jgi:hypothetical protein
MRSPAGVRRVIITVLDGLRPDAIERFELPHLRRLALLGSATMTGTTVTPSVTTAVMTSLLTGVSPSVHGLVTDRLHIPRGTRGLSPLPSALPNGCPTSAFFGEVGVIFRGIGHRVARRLGVSDVHFGGETAPEVLARAEATLRRQRRGLILLHWADADQAGHAQGWMSAEYADASRRLDSALGRLTALIDIPRDPSTLLIVLADHGGGGTASHDHESDHPFDRTIPILLLGGSIVPGGLSGAIRLLDVPATVLWALGVVPPSSYEGRVLSEAFVDQRELPPAVA